MLWLSALALALPLPMDALASDMEFGGSVTGSSRTTNSEVGADSKQEAFTATLDGAGFVWRPWFATLRLKLNVSQTRAEVQQDDPPTDQTSKARLLSGEARMNLFPRSRFPLDSFVDMFDSRIESDTVGVALTDVNTLRRERVGLTQQYRTVSGDSQYTVQALRTHVLEQDRAEEHRADAAASGSNHFGNQTVSYRVSTEQSLRDETATDTRRRLDTGMVRHEAHPSPSLTVESVVDGSRDHEWLVAVPVRQETARSADNYVTWRPEGSELTLRTHLGANTRDTVAGDGDTHTETHTGTANVGYNITRHLRFAADAGAVRTRVNDETAELRSFENAALNYTPAPSPLTETVDYVWSGSAAVGNNDSNIEDSVQSASAGLRHGLNYRSSNGEGRTVTSSVTQGFQSFHNSRGTRLDTLNLLTSAAAVWEGATSTQLVQFNASDARTRGREATLDTVTDVDRVVDTADAHGSLQLRASRFASWEADLLAGETVEVDQGESARTVFGNASAGFSYRHVFGVHQLMFRTRLEYASHRTVGGEGKPDDEERGSWDSRFDYRVGLLTLAARRTYTQYNGQQTVVTVFSASRAF